MTEQRHGRRTQDQGIVLGSKGAMKIFVILLMLLSIVVTYSVTSATMGAKVNLNSSDIAGHNIRLGYLEKQAEEMRKVNASLLLVNAEILAFMRSEDR